MAQNAIRQIDVNKDGIVDAAEWNQWWWGSSWSTELLGRENSSALSPLTLAALAGDEIMFEHVLEATRIPKWSYGPVACHEMPLEMLDTLRIFDLGDAEEGDGCVTTNTVRLPRRRGDPIDMKVLEESGKQDDFKRSVGLIMLVEQVEGIADNDVMVWIQDMKWDKWASHYFHLSVGLYISYLVFVWLLTFRYSMYKQELDAPGATNVQVPGLLRFWEHVVFILTIAQGLLVFVDWFAVYQARMTQEKTIEQARGHVEHHLERAYQRKNQFGPYLYRGPVWAADTTNREANDGYEEQYHSYRAERNRRSPGYSSRCCLTNKVFGCFAQCANRCNRIVCSRRTYGRSESHTEERKYVGKNNCAGCSPLLCHCMGTYVCVSAATVALFFPPLV